MGLRRCCHIGFLFLAALVLGSFNIMAQQASAPPTGEETTTLFKAAVRRVVLDVVVTDSSGKAVKGLTKSDFSVAEDGKPQTVLSFDPYGFDGGMDYQPPKLPTEPPNTFVNLPATPEKGPLYVLLYDLNDMDNEDQMSVTVNQHEDQMRGRAQLIKFIESKPEGARFAIFVFSDGLHLIQGFTSDRAKLFAAVDPHSPKPHIPQVYLMGQNTGRGSQSSALWVMNLLGNYLDGLPGRKNLIWFSGGFPLSLSPVENDGPRYTEQVKSTLDLLARNQISIYPVDVRGVVIQNWHDLAASPSNINAGAEPVSNRNSGAPSITEGSGAPAQGPLAIGNSLILGSYMVMDEIARETGGKAFYGRNDVAVALADATETGGTYYSLTYEPSNRQYDGKLRSIKVDLAKKGYQLAYRRAYYGSDSDEGPMVQMLRASSKPGAPQPAPGTASSTRRIGDSLSANMEYGAPEAHQLIFGAHLHAVGVAAKGTPAQMATLADQPAYFKTRKRNAPPKPMTPIDLQRYAVDYTVMAHQLQVAGSGAPLELELAVAAYDADGRMLNALVNRATPPDAVDGAPQRKSFRAEQELDVPLAAKTIRLAVRDVNTDRIGAMEVQLPLAAEAQAAR